VSGLLLEKTDGNNQRNACLYKHFKNDVSNDFVNGRFDIGGGKDAFL